MLTFLRMLPVDATVLDIGANVGAISLLLARRCAKGRVYAFEPIPENRNAARAVFRLARVSNVRLFAVGCGERDEVVSMVMPSDGDVRLQGLAHVVRDRADDGVYYRVELVALDTYSPLRDRPIAALKIDVENHEIFVLRGAVNIIARDRPLIYLELWPGENKRACMALLAELGYAPFAVRGGALVPYDERLHDDVNLVFWPQPVGRDHGVHPAPSGAVPRSVRGSFSWTMRPGR